MENLIFYFKTKEIALFLLLIAFVFFKWESLYTLPWSDEYFYPSIIKYNWSFFLPWNYRPEYFMGHPAGLPFIFYTIFKFFGVSIWTAKNVILIFSLLCLFNLYKMTESLFQDKWTAFLSVSFTVSIPLFWFHSTLVLGHIPLMALGFGTIYSFLSHRLKLLCLYSLCLVLIRESALAFLLPLVLYGIFKPAYRRAVYCIFPSLLLFVSHFLICFIRTGDWFKHPHALRTLPHNPTPEFFNFSLFFERFGYFYEDFFHQISYWFLGLLLISFSLFVFKKIRQESMFFNILALFENLVIRKKLFFRNNQLAERKNKNNIKEILSYKHPVLILLFVCILFFLFFINFPTYSFRNFFPISIIFYPLSIYFIIKNIPLSKIVLGMVCCLLLIQNIFPKSSLLIYQSGAGLKYSGYRIEENYKQKIFSAKTFISYLEKNWGEAVTNTKKTIYMPYPYDQSMIGPEYGFVKNQYDIDHFRFMDEPEKYGAVAFVKKKIFELPYNEKVYIYLKNSDTFVEQALPPHLKKFILFLNLDVLDYGK